MDKLFLIGKQSGSVKMNQTSVHYYLCEFGFSALGELAAQDDGPVRIRRDFIIHSHALTPDPCEKRETFQNHNVKSGTDQDCTFYNRTQMLGFLKKKHTSLTIFQGLDFLWDKSAVSD